MLALVQVDRHQGDVEDAFFSHEHLNPTRVGCAWGDVQFQVWALLGFRGEGRGLLICGRGLGSQDPVEPEQRQG